MTVGDRWARRAAGTVAAAALVTGLAVVAAGCGSSSDSADAGASTGASGAGGELSLVAYAVPEPAFAEIIPAFQATPAGKDVTFSQSYGASGDQSRAVANGLPADVVNLSVAPDITRLVDAGLVAKDWEDNATKGVPATSVVVFGVRPGNPKGIKEWTDLTRDGIGVVTANFQTSGSAKWNALAAWGAARKRGESEAGATTYLNELYDNVVAQEKSGREATSTFQAGRGDVLLTYENEAIAAKRKGVELDYVVPSETMKIEAPAAVTEKAPKAASDFLDFLYTPEAQRLWAKAGFRPVNEAIAKETSGDLPATKTVFDIGFFGGWPAAQAKFFEEPEGIAVKASQQAAG